MSIDSDLIRGHVDTIILKTLTTGDKYGYEIIKEITEKSNGTYELKQPTLYSCLKRLEGQGLISAYWKNSDIGGKRHYYKLTKKGRNFYETNMNQWFASRSIIDNLMGSEKTNTTNESTPLKDTENLATETLESAEQEKPEENPEVSLENEETTGQLVTEELSPLTGAQLTLDENNAIIQTETTPRNFNIEDISEDEEELLKGYYKTDEDQINFFASSTFGESETEDVLSKIIANNQAKENTLDGYNEETVSNVADKEQHKPTTTGDDYDDISLDSTFYKTFGGADLSLYRESSNATYFDNIRDNLSEVELNKEQEENTELEQEEKESELNDFSHSYSGFTFGFGSTTQESDNTEENPVNNDDDPNNYGYKTNEDDLNSYSSNSTYSFISSYDDEEDDDNSSSELNFGKVAEDDDDDADLYMPSFNEDTNSFNDEIDDEDEQSITNFASSFGEDDDTNYNQIIEDNNASNEEDYNNEALDILDSSDYAEKETANVYYDDFNIGLSTRGSSPLSYSPAYTEINDKEKLNHLSSYALTPVYNLKDAITNETNNDITYNDLTEELKSAGLTLRPYSKKEKASEKDKNYLLANKIKSFSSLISYGILLLLLLGSYFIAKTCGYLNLSKVDTSIGGISYFLIAGAVMFVLPLIYTTIFFINPTKKVKPNYSSIVSLIFALLFFIVCINVIYTINILLGFTKFTQTDYNHLLWLLPLVCSSYIIIQSACYSILFKSRKFNST